MRRKDFTKEQILAAMARTKSNRAAARYLNCSYQHYKMWAKFYEATKEGYANLFEQHLNPHGIGIPKFLNGGNPRKRFPLKEIIEGKLLPTSFNPAKIKYRLLQEGYLKEECYGCGFHEHRVLDHKIPILLHFKDGNKMNYLLENLEMLCYNCYFLYQGDLFTGKQIEGIEDHKSISHGKVDWEVDDYTQERLRELGLYEPKPPEDGSEYISKL
jgi:hypothetical protein